MIVLQISVVERHLEILVWSLHFLSSWAVSLSRVGPFQFLACDDFLNCADHWIYKKVKKKTALGWDSIQAMI